MLLSIALFVFSGVLLIIFVGICVWWVKYGKNLYKMFENTRKMSQNPLNNDIFSQQMDVLKHFLGKK